MCVCGLEEKKVNVECVCHAMPALRAVHQLHNALMEISLVVAHRNGKNKQRSKKQTKICRFDSQRDNNTLTRIHVCCWQQRPVVQAAKIDAQSI